MISGKIEARLADKGYDADATHEKLSKAQIEAAIPARQSRRNHAPNDTEKYKWHILIEKLFIKLKT
jgi:hypothetical protein